MDAVPVDQYDADAVVAATWVGPPSAGEDPLADYARATSGVVLAAYAYAHLRHLMADAAAEEGQGAAGSRS